MFKTVEQLMADGEWDSFYISGRGLVPVIKSLGDNITGLELGVARAETAVYLLHNCPNISHYYCVDPWQPYMDWNGMISNEMISAMKNTALKNLQVFGDLVEIIQENSAEANKKVKDGSLDFIFIDGDHSYEAAFYDMSTYWSKVKVGGLFAGHDAGMANVDRALVTFRAAYGITTDVKFCDNQCWYWIKE